MNQGNTFFLLRPHIFLSGQIGGVAPTTSVEIGYGTTSKERSFGNVCRTILRCRSYAPLTWFHIQFLQTLPKLRSFEVVSYPISTDVVRATLLFVHSKKMWGINSTFFIPFRRINCKKSLKRVKFTKKT